MSRALTTGEAGRFEFWGRPCDSVLFSAGGGFLDDLYDRYLLEAWKILRDRGVEGELRLAGPGELRSTLEAQVNASGLADSVRFLGAVPHDALLKIYGEVEIAAVVLASIDMGHGLHEGIPVALIEAMSFGIPVIATTTLPRATWGIAYQANLSAQSKSGTAKSFRAAITARAAISNIASLCPHCSASIIRSAPARNAGVSGA
jgi:hypothetical protein